MTKSRQWFTLVAAVLALSPGLQAQNRFEDVTEAVVVEVPVQVTKDGVPVRGLSAEDFEVLDERKEQTLTAFEVVDLTGDDSVSGSPPVALSARRHFLFLFDLSFSNPPNITRARRAALDVLDSLHPSDLAGVATFSSVRGPELLLGFTGDRRQTEVAIRTLGLPQLVERHTDPLALMITSPFETPAVEASEGGGRVNLDRDLMFQENLEDLSIGMRRENRQQAQGQVEKMVRDFRTLARVLDSAQGRKHVVLFSEGVDTSLILGTAERGRTGSMNEAVLSGQYWEIDSEERYGNTAALSFFQTMTEEFRRVDATIQAVDISNLDRDVDSAARSHQDSLFMMADETGGELYGNFTDLAGAMRQMLERTGVTYLLAFQPDDLEPDGSYHRLRVKLKGGPSGAQVVHRPGYYAPRPYPERTPMERQLEAAAKMLGGTDSGNLPTSILATAFPTGEERAYVPVFLELEGPTLLASSGTDKVMLEVYVYGMDNSGQVNDFFTQSVTLERKQVAENLSKAGLRVFGSLALPPGRQTVRALVRNAESGHHGMESTNIEVPVFDGKAALCTPPLFPDIQTDWLLVRESSEGDEAIEYPFTARGNPFIPFARPVVGGSAAVGFVCFGLTGDAQEIDATVRTLEGEEIDGPSIRVIESNPGEGPHMKRILAEFIAEGLTPGDYVLSVEVKGADGTYSPGGEIRFTATGT